MKRYKLILFTLTAASAMLTQCTSTTDNPLLKPYDTPFGVPPFDQIRVEHFEPAIAEGIRQNLAEVQAIIDCPDAPTFDNVILPLDNSGRLLQEVLGILENIDAANTNAGIQGVLKSTASALAKHSDDIRMNPALFAKVKAVYDGMVGNPSYTPEQRLLIEKKYNSFVRGGANLSAEQQEQLRAVNQELSMLALRFSENLLAENNSFQMVLDSAADLQGLPESVCAMAAEEAAAKGFEGKWLFNIYKTSLLPFLTHSQCPDLRAKLYSGYYMKGDNNNANDNKDIVAQIVRLRQQRAQLLGFPTHAHYVLDVNMAKTPEAVYNLLNQIWPRALNLAKQELADIRTLAKAETGSDQVQAADWWYYAEKVRKQRYDLDEEMIRPYLSLDAVKNGIFDLSNRLYGISFKQLSNIPIYHPEVQVYEVLEADGKHLGLLYLDFFPRESKSVGAWCTSFRDQRYNPDGSKQTPIVSIVCNFTKPMGSTPSLLTFDEAETFFHEFGHALHGLFRDVPYVGLSGVPRDFVELPSQIMEHWAGDPKFLKLYALHYQTGQPIPDDLIQKMAASGHFNQGFRTTELMAASLLDMDYHTLEAANASIANVVAFERSAMERIGLVPEILPRYRSTYFSHIFGSVMGYSSGYYSYTWSEVLDADAYEAFVETGDIFNREVAARFRSCVLSKGGSKDAMQLYVDFRGKEPGLEPYFKNRGLE